MQTLRKRRNFRTESVWNPLLIIIVTAMNETICWPPAVVTAAGSQIKTGLTADFRFSSICLSAIFVSMLRKKAAPGYETTDLWKHDLPLLLLLAFPFSGVATANHRFPFEPILCIFYSDTNNFENMMYAHKMGKTWLLNTAYLEISSKTEGSSWRWRTSSLQNRCRHSSVRESVKSWTMALTRDLHSVRNLNFMFCFTARSIQALPSLHINYILKNS